MREYKFYGRKIAVAASMFLVLGSIDARAAVVDLRNAIRSEASLIHHFSF